MKAPFFSGLRPSLLFFALSTQVIAIGAFPALLAAEENQCVSCHETEHLPISLGHSFDEWRVSTHGKVGVACEKCHGGDPTISEAKQAHVGVLPTTSPDSLVDPT